MLTRTDIQLLRKELEGKDKKLSVTVIEGAMDGEEGEEEQNSSS